MTNSITFILSFSLLSFIPGSVLLNVELNDELLFQIGQLAAKITAALEVCLFVHHYCNKV